jgi:hypothetical protein
MIAYPAAHVEFGKAWRARVMKVPKRQLRRILEQAIRDIRLPAKLHVKICFALLIGPLMFFYNCGQEYAGFVIPPSQMAGIRRHTCDTSPPALPTNWSFRFAQSPSFGDT